MAPGFLKHTRDWTITRDAIIRLAVRLARPFTYGELSAEIEEHDGLKIDRRGYAGALEAVAQNIRSSEPPWTAMVVNSETGRPGDGIWKANPDDRRYANAGMLSESRREVWLDAQRAWCIAAARVTKNRLISSFVTPKGKRGRRLVLLIDLMMEDNAESAAEKYGSDKDESDSSGS